MGRRKATPAKDAETVRICANIRSRKAPDQRCSLVATQGEFCTRHQKHPIRFQEKIVVESTVNLQKLAAAATIQKFWRSRVPRLRILRQGAATNQPQACENATDLQTLEAVTSIPILYRWSYRDSKGHSWMFDLRSLNMLLSKDPEGALHNPQNRELFPETEKLRFIERCAQLRKKKQCLLHATDQEMTPDQLWHQRLLDMTMKYDALGYHISLQWFEELGLAQLQQFQIELWELWFFRLQLTQEAKATIVPTWNDTANPLFRVAPRDIRSRHDRDWWKRMLVDLLERLVSSATTKENRGLGALQGMTAFALVSRRVRQFYPWLVQPD